MPCLSSMKIKSSKMLFHPGTDQTYHHVKPLTRSHNFVLKKPRGVITGSNTHHQLVLPLTLLIPFSFHLKYPMDRIEKVKL